LKDNFLFLFFIGARGLSRFDRGKTKPSFSHDCLHLKFDGKEDSEAEILSIHDLQAFQNQKSEQEIP
jgi:hypothetical protein